MGILREKLSIYTLYLVMILTAYLYGGLRLISIFSVFAVSLCSFIFAFYPFNKLENSNKNLKSLFRFPPFYFCILLSLYVLIQILNPSVNIIKLDGGFATNILEHNKYLPSSVASESIDHTIFEAFLSMLSVFFALLTVWISFRDFRKINNLCLIVAYSGTLLALLSILNYTIPSLGLFPYIDKITYAASGSFFYHAHGNSFFICILGFLGIAIINSILFKNSWKNSKIFLLPSIFIILCAVILTGGMSGTFFAICTTILILINILFAIKKSKKTRYLAGLTFCIVFVVLSAAIFLPRNTAVQNAWKRISMRIDDVSSHLGSRNHIKKIAVDMIASGGDFTTHQNKSAPDYSKIIFGRGLYSFEPLSENYSIESSTNPVYQKQWISRKKEIKTVKFAHCDPLEIVFDFGILGTGIIALWALWYIFSLCKTRRINFMIFFSGLSSMIVVAVYSCNDTLFYNPFVALNFAVLSMVVLRLSKFKIE